MGVLSVSEGKAVGGWVGGLKSGGSSGGEGGAEERQHRVEDRQRVKLAPESW